MRKNHYKLKMSGEGINRFSCLVICVVVSIIAACKKPYIPPVSGGSKSYLVVDGVINSGNDSTFIRISRTSNLDDNTLRITTEHGATVSLVSDGAEYPFTETAADLYASGGLNLDASRKYRLQIITSNNQRYLSDEIVMKDAPGIDNVNYKVEGDFVKIYVDGHDATNNTRYYRWDFDEDWRFHAKYSSGFIYDKTLDSLRERKPSEDNFFCFGHAPSNTIVLTSTTKLSQDVVSNALLTTIPSPSQKISLRYSILVKQHALDKEAYQFWENLKKNTEELGGIFDAQPSELKGNIHNVNDPDEPVIGYISGGKMQTKRIYIDKEDLPNWVTDYSSRCQLDSTKLKNADGINEVIQYIYSGQSTAVTAIYIQGILIGYMRTANECADCTLTNGKKQAPAFWQDRQ